MAVVNNETGNMLMEVVSPRIEIHWDSAKQSGQIVFSTARLVSLNGEVVAQQDLNHLMIVPIEELIPRSFPVVVGKDADGNDIKVDVPTTLVMGYIKSAFDTNYQEKIVNYVPPSPSANPPAPPPTEV